MASNINENLYKERIAKLDKFKKDAEEELKAVVEINGEILKEVKSAKEWST